MIERFSPNFREQALEALRVHAAEQAEILGTLLVGSGARGFNDEHSDIDIIFAAKGQSEVARVVDELSAWLPHEFRPVFTTTYQHQPDIFVICAIMENGLELDLGVWSIAKLYATKSDWKLVQSQSPIQAQLIESAMQQTEPSFERTANTEVAGDDPLWQFVNGLVVARLRQDPQGITDAESILIDKVGGLDYDSIMEAARKAYINPAQLQFIESILK